MYDTINLFLSPIPVQERGDSIGLSSLLKRSNKIQKRIDFFIDWVYYNNRRSLLEKHTRKNAFCAYEVESAMECGDYGGLQRWQLTIIHLSFGERKLHLQRV